VETSDGVSHAFDLSHESDAQRDGLRVQAWLLPTSERGWRLMTRAHQLEEDGEWRRLRILLDEVGAPSADASQGAADFGDWSVAVKPGHEDKRGPITFSQEGATGSIQLFDATGATPNFYPADLGFRVSHTVYFAHQKEATQLAQEAASPLRVVYDDGNAAQTGAAGAIGPWEGHTDPLSVAILETVEVLRSQQDPDNPTTN